MADLLERLGFAAYRPFDIWYGMVDSFGPLPC